MKKHKNEKKISLKKYLSLCIDFENDPSEEKEKAIQDFLSQLVIKEYLPLRDKAIEAMQILVEMNDDFDIVGSSSCAAMGKVYHGLCSYAVNLEKDIGQLSLTYPVHDLIMKYGLYEHIKKNCKEDYDRFCEYVNNMIDAQGVYRLIQTASLFDETEHEEWIKVMQDVKNILTPDFIKKIESINLAAPNLSEDFVKKMAEKVVDASEKTQKNDENKYSHIEKDIKKHYPEFQMNTQEKK